MRDRVFSATVVAVLAIGLGVGHLFFTLTYAHLVRGLPIAAADRVLAVSTLDARGTDLGLSAGDLTDLRQAQRTFEDLAAYTTTAVTLGDEDRAPERVEATALSASAFAMTGVVALAGRTITTDDEQPGTPPAVVLTERLWQSRYQRDAAVVGRQVRVDGAAATVVGVISDRSGLPSAAAMFLPLAATPPVGASRDSRTLRVFGRLNPGADLTAAAADLDAIAADLARRFPATNAGTRLRLEPLNERLLGGRRRAAAGGHLSSPGWWSSPWPLPTPATCSWSAQRRGAARSRCARRSARAADASSASCWWSRSSWPGWPRSSG